MGVAKVDPSISQQQGAAVNLREQQVDTRSISNYELRTLNIILMQLDITKRGGKLGVQDGRFRVSWSEAEEFFPAEQVRRIMLHPATALTHEAVKLAIQQEVEIMLIDGTGFPFARVWSPRFGSISTIRKNQVHFAVAPEALTWIKGELIAKLENQTVLLSLLQPEDPTLLPTLQASGAKIEDYRQRVEAIEAESLAEAAPTLRGLEGNSSRIYFQAISQALPEVYQFEGRSRRPAQDMFNALLNYAYGMLYGLIEGVLIKVGLDPYLGIFHRDDYGRPVLVYDMIERYRLWAEYVVVFLCMDRAVFIEYFDLRDEGFWLNRDGKRLLIHSVNDYLHEVVEIGSLARSRLVHLELRAQAFAQELKQFEGR